MRFHAATTYRQAFSLVELSIVLVILGLLTGGILSGQSLIRAAELRSVTADMNRYEAAVFSFRDKYFALPGDMTNATAFWGAASTCPNGAGTGTQTCNGDGDGFINSSTSIFYEAARAWQQLANAGLIEGNYTGITNPGGPFLTPGVSAPKSKISTAGYTLVSPCPSAFADGLPNTSTGMCWGQQSVARLAIYFGAPVDVTRGPTVLQPNEAWNLDTKSDDGLPDQGKVQSGSSAAGTGCFTSTTSPSGYNLTLNSKVCNLARLIIQ